MRSLSVLADSSSGFTYLLRAATLKALVVCAWVSIARADHDDPQLPGLFESLKAARVPAQGQRIAEVWNQHDNQGVDEITQQGRVFLARSRLRLAQGNFTTVTRVSPGFAEAWNKRASVLYRMGRLDDSARSIAETLAREPRHFLAIAGLGLIYLQTVDLEEALRAFDYALGINPHLAGTRVAADKIRQRLSP